MNSIDFINQTVYVYNEDCIHNLKEKFIGKYIFFNIINECDVSKKIFSEKVVDYIEKIELKTGDLFSIHLKKYIDNLNSLVKNHLIEGSRAKRYFNYACQKIDIEEIDLEKIVDFTRIILCLYSKIIEEGHSDIDNFDFAINSIDLNMILSAMEDEKIPEVDFVVFNLGTKKKFDFDDIYSSDALTFTLIIILYYYLVNFKARGEY